MYDKLTKKDIEKIEKEIEYRKLVKRKELIEAVKEARAHGDLSENFEYYAAKREKNQNEGRINYLTRMLRTATIIESSNSSDTASVDTVVGIKMLNNNEQMSFKIVTNVRGSSLDNRITIDSPMAKALMGHRVGDIVRVCPTPDFSYEVEILSIEKDDEDEEINSF